MPTWPYNDEHLNIRSEIEQCRTRRNHGFQLYIDAIPEMGAILSECAEVGWKITTARCCEYLMECLGDAKKTIGGNFQIASEAHAGAEFQGGDEHHILLPESDSITRVSKWTYGDNFGLQLKVFEHDPELMNHHVISTGNPDPVKYLRRWIILNNIAPPITRLEGILPPDFLRNERLPRIAISQRELPPENPTHLQIVKGFREIGFIEVSEYSYYRQEDNILLGDAAPRNIRFENGTLIPFDAVAEHPEGAAKAWCIDRIKK